MCVQDLALGKGRRFHPSVRTTTGMAPQLQADGKRVAVLISWQGYYTFDATAAINLVDQLLLYSGDNTKPVPFARIGGLPQVLLLDIEHYGQLVTDSITSVVANNTSLAEVTMTPIFSDIEVKALAAGRVE